DQGFRRGRRGPLGRSLKQRLHKGGEHPVGLSRAGQDSARACQQAAVETVAGDALFLQVVGDVGVADEGLWLEPAVHEDLVGAGLVNQAAKFSLAVAAPQDEPPSAPAQRGVQGAQGFVQPPPGGGAGTTPLPALVENINGKDRPFRGKRGGQGGIIAQPQVAAKPQNDGGRGVTGQDDSLSPYAGW